MNEDELRAGARRLGRKGGLKGGKARAEKLTQDERTKAAREAAEKRWDPDHIEMRVTLHSMAADGELVQFAGRKFQSLEAWQVDENRKLPLSKEDMARERRFAQQAIEDLSALARREAREKGDE